MRPLNLRELDELIAHLVLRRHENTDQTLRIQKISTELDGTQNNGMLRLLETLLQLIHVEHIRAPTTDSPGAQAKSERSSSLKQTESQRNLEQAFL